ncbi:MAG: carbohydrate-binding domain-containing protein [Bacteroidales bacterium]|nr:carbohydrate-binding domain-containing protein [Bacteroidales bacterium]
MKKYLLLSLILALTALSASASTVAGDVNGDGECTGSDVTALYNYILYNDASAIVNGDQNGDGDITGSDVTAVYNIILYGSSQDEDIEDYNINIAYDGESATVTVAKNISGYITTTINGAHVNIVADAALQDSIFFNLSGSTSNGSFYMDGDYKCYVNLTDLAIHNPDSAAINIDNGKRIDLTLNGTSTLTDATGGAQRACCFINGHVVIAGEGTLNITGNSKHAYFSDEYTRMTSGTINVANSASDGMHINQYFMMDGGTITINTTGGDGIDVGMTKDATDSNNGEFILNNGTISITTSGDAVKAIKCESIMTIAGGSITATTSGNAVYDATKADLSSCAAIKCDSTFVMTSGTVYLTSTGAGGKGLNTDGSVKIGGGTFTAITTGDVYEYSSTLDTKAGGVKADGSITITGGTVRVAASNDDARAFNGELGFFTNGGYILGIGGKSSTVSTGYTQSYKYLRNQVINGGTTYTPLVNNASVGISFDIPSIYSNSSALVVVSTPEIN